PVTGGDAFTTCSTSHCHPSPRGRGTRTRPSSVARTGASPLIGARGELGGLEGAGARGPAQPSRKAASAPRQTAKRMRVHGCHGPNRRARRALEIHLKRSTRFHVRSWINRLPASSKTE